MHRGRGRGEGRTPAARRRRQRRKQRTCFAPSARGTAWLARSPRSGGGGAGGSGGEGALLLLPRHGRRAPLTPLAQRRRGLPVPPFAPTTRRGLSLRSPRKGGGRQEKGKLEGKGRRRGGTKMSTATGAGAKLELLAGVAWFYERHYMIAQGSRRACNDKWGSRDI